MAVIKGFSNSALFGESSYDDDITIAEDIDRIEKMVQAIIDTPRVINNYHTVNITINVLSEQDKLELQHALGQLALGNPQE